MSAPRVDVAELAIDSSGVTQALSDFNVAMAKFSDAVASAGGKARNASDDIDRVGQSAEESGKKADEASNVFNKWGEELEHWAMGFVAFEAAKRSIEEIIDVVEEAEYTQARLNTVLTSMGGIAGVDAQQIERLADEIQSYSIFTDEAVKQAATRLLVYDQI